MEWLFNFIFEYTIRKVQKNHIRLKLNGTHHLLVYSDDVNLLGDNIGIIKQKTETLADTCNEVGLEVNTEKTKYTSMLLSYHQNAGQNHDMTVTDTYSVQKEIKRRLNSGNACYHSVQKVLSSHLLSKRKIIIITIIKEQYTKL
jgi:hypothetical protein